MSSACRRSGNLHHYRENAITMTRQEFAHRNSHRSGGSRVRTDQLDASIPIQEHPEPEFVQIDVFEAETQLRK